MRSVEILALGSVLSIIGSAGIIFFLLFGQDLMNSTYSIIAVFILGIASGVGITLALFNLKYSDKTSNKNL